MPLIINHIPSLCQLGCATKTFERASLDAGRLSQVAEHTGYVIGVVPPMSLPESIRVLADESLKTYEKLIIGSGVLGYAFGLSGAALCELMKEAEFGVFGKAPE